MLGRKAPNPRWRSNSPANECRPGWATQKGPATVGLQGARCKITDLGMKRDGRAIKINGCYIAVNKEAIPAN